MLLSNKHVFNINRALKDIRLDIIANFIHTNNRGLTITTNKVAFVLDLTTIEKYIKNINNINSENIILSRLPQSKSYLKILYLIKDTNVSVSANRVLYSSHIFNNIVLTSKPCVIKVSSKLYIAVIWINIWDIQSSFKAKVLINRYFNIGSYIATIKSTNINLGIL